MIGRQPKIVLFCVRNYPAERVSGLKGRLPWLEIVRRSEKGRSGVWGDGRDTEDSTGTKPEPRSWLDSPTLAQLAANNSGRVKVNGHARAVDGTS